MRIIRIASRLVMQKQPIIEGQELCPKIHAVMSSWLSSKTPKKAPVYSRDEIFTDKGPTWGKFPEQDPHDLFTAHVLVVTVAFANFIETYQEMKSAD